MDGEGAVHVKGSYGVLSSMVAPFLEGDVDHDFASSVSRSDSLSILLQELERRGRRFCVFGGWLRDTIASHSIGTPSPRDIDIVVDGASMEMLQEIVLADTSPTIFGGIQSHGVVQFDIWPLSETYLVKRLGLPATFESLLRTADFNINAGAYFPAQGGDRSIVLDAGMSVAIKNRIIGFNASILPFPTIQCARIAAYAVKLRFEIESSVGDFIVHYIAENDCIGEVEAGLRSYQPSVAAEAIEFIRELMNTRL